MICNAKNASSFVASCSNSRDFGQNSPSDPLCQPFATGVPRLHHYILRYKKRLSLTIDAGQDTPSAFCQNGPSLTVCFRQHFRVIMVKTVERSESVLEYQVDNPRTSERSAK